ncbi:zinc finger and BTB domain-containing protein 24 [Octopus bimaculoides]|uniref:C2H2-type domain-containing protein n=1 Tax=Octopus bimaculoides TaxID=37653 RepID=A0A0L8H4X8_OCTBM|nr:zinc finger and BTB domain-containing protein 24 [Octopus bimaculoides]XP_014775401.1 zinc finger and BTB domain-containing protein 24 [Octopus bimaculoides]XP_014775402.1 zinc finger and BTB domain-containing protein 24 [Octopus bimaculoides]|eukprot:XP_014775400.1 PREDICTED: zinc finger and BTB domain-containing protein 24-like [Octopus bimaculoides]
MCGKKLTSLSRLMEHKRVHTGERPYVCQVCQKRFTQKAHLVIHKRTHTGEKPYACHICHKRFAQSSHLNNHKRIHTGEKPYFCNVCNLGFSRKQRLELHVLQHAQQKSTNSQQINNNDDVNSTNSNDNKSVAFTSEAEAAYQRPLLDSTQSQAQISAGIGDAGMQTMNFSHRRKPAFVTRVSNEEYEIMQNNFESQTAPDQEDGGFSLSSLTSAHHSSLMKSEPKDFDEFEAITHELEAIAHPNINQVMSSENLMVRQVDPLDQDENDQPKSLEDSLVIHLDGTTHSEVLRDVHSSTEPDVGVMCAVSTTDMHHAQAGDDGDSITSESNNSNCEQSITSRAPKRSILGHHSVKTSKSLNSQTHLNRHRSLLPNRTTSVSTSSSSYARINSRVCLVDFSTEELITHLMSRDDVYRCDFCCLLFQDAAMYHLHRSMHDKMDCRCCNICGKLSKDKHDFIAHFLTEHK